MKDEIRGLFESGDDTNKSLAFMLMFSNNFTIDEIVDIWIDYPEEHTYIPVYYWSVEEFELNLNIRVMRVDFTNRTELKYQLWKRYGEGVESGVIKRKIITKNLKHNPVIIKELLKELLETEIKNVTKESVFYELFKNY